MSAPIPARVPGALGYARHWVLRKGKKPCDQWGNPKGWHVSSFWITYQDAIAVLKHNGGGFDGLGFVIAREPLRGSKQIIGLDLDCCRDPETGWVSPWAEARLELLSSYSEVTPSLTGFHIWAYGKLPEGTDSAFSEGQDPSELPPETWERIKSAKPTAEKCNSLEIYEDGPRHFTVTGLALDQYPGELMHRQDELDQLLEECVKQEPKIASVAIGSIDSEWFRQMSEATKGQGLPALSITDVVNTRGWEESGGQLFGPHPTLGSSTGRNVVINPGMNVYAYMHNGLKRGGDAWTWLACEAGIISWENAGVGALRDPESMIKVKEYAVQKGHFPRETLFSTIIPNKAKIDDKIIVDSDPLTEGGNATRLVRLYGDDIKYCHTYKKWLIWDGTRWQIDSNGRILRLAEDIVRYLYKMAANAESKDDRDALAKFAKKADGNFHIKNVLEIAKNREQVAITSNILDCDEWQLCAPNCSINLKTLEHRKPSREDLITKRIGCNYEANAICPLWESFLEKIFRGDQELIRYLQRAVGYTLTGSTQEQVYFFLHGSGANGKSVFLGILRALMGEYAKQASFDTFLVQRDTKVRNDLAALAGARLIAASEAEEGSRMSMQVIKAWTGCEPITARFLFGEDFTFKPVGKIWMAANTKPIISERNFAAWRRVHLIPFLVTIPKTEQDKELESKLIKELPGILNWALEGLKEYHRIGLEAPLAVKAATETYRRENDSLEAFIAEACQVQKLAVCKNKDLFYAYERFCYEFGLNALKQNKFSMELKTRSGLESKHTENGTIWRGIGLKPEYLESASGVQQISEKSEKLTDLTANPQSLSCLASQGGDIDKASGASGNASADIKLTDFLTPETKAKIWAEAYWLLKNQPRKDGAKRGLTSKDISDRSKQSIKDIDELLRSNGWESSRVEVSGVEIWWAPEKALKAFGVET